MYYLMLIAMIPIIVLMIYSSQPLIGISFSIFYMIVIFLIANKIDKNNNSFESTYDWKEVHAKVIKKNVIKLTCFTLFLKMDKYKMATNSYKIDITYKYDIDGEVYTSNQYALSYKGDADCNYLYPLDEAKKLLYKLTKDNHINVYVNPENPEESVIMRGRSKSYGFPYSALYIISVVIAFFAYEIYL